MRSTTVTTRDLLGEHLTHLRLRGMSEATISARRWHLHRLALYFGCAPEELLALTERDLDTWQHTIGGMSASYRMTFAVHIRMYFRWAWERGHVRDNPTRVLILPKIARRVPHPIPTVDLETAIAMAPPRVRAMLVLAAYCGLRAGEIASLTRAQVRDTATPAVLTVIGKGDRERIIPLSRPVIVELHRYGLAGGSGMVFPRLDGRPGLLKNSRVSHLCNDYLHSLGIPESLHKLRHFYGTSMYQVSQDLRMVQEVMGHGSPITTSGYVGYVEGVAHEAAEAIAAQAPFARQVRGSTHLRSVQRAG